MYTVTYRAILSGKITRAFPDFDRAAYWCRSIGRVDLIRAIKCGGVPCQKD